LKENISKNKMEGRRGRRRKQLQNDLQDKEDPGARKAKY